VVGWVAACASAAPEHVAERSKGAMCMRWLVQCVVCDLVDGEAKAVSAHGTLTCFPSAVCLFLIRFLLFSARAPKWGALTVL
jgi:hypothetical protein